MKTTRQPGNPCSLSIVKLTINPTALYSPPHYSTNPALYTIDSYAPSRQHRRCLPSAHRSCARSGLYDGWRDEPRRERMLPCHARTVRGHGKDGLLPDEDSDRCESADCGDIPVGRYSVDRGRSSGASRISGPNLPIRLITDARRLLPAWSSDRQNHRP